MTYIVKFRVCFRVFKKLLVPVIFNGHWLFEFVEISDLFSGAFGDLAGSLQAVRECMQF
jgi:hypothetical protein